ncbi:MAG: hypothetical protein JXB07_10095 [Anaerolineae bacterium]|nr:hypothetical protein [Anaerolineae bacterium]
MTNDGSEHEETATESPQLQSALIVIGIAILLITLGLLVIAFVLASNAETSAPGVRVIRDLLIIVVTLEVIVIGAAVTVFLIQVARLVNLISNEVEPLISATSDTINTVRGTALFLSKNMVEPVVSMNSALRGLAKVAGDVDALRKAAGVAVQVANAVSPTGTHTVVPPSPVGEEASDPASGVTEKEADRKPVKKRRTSKKTCKEG